MQGVETPAEAFVAGSFRAYGSTVDLYHLHDFFVAIVELTFTQPLMRKVVIAFEKNELKDKKTANEADVYLLSVQGSS